MRLTSKKQCAENLSTERTCYMFRFLSQNQPQKLFKLSLPAFRHYFKKFLFHNPILHVFSLNISKYLDLEIIFEI